MRVQARWRSISYPRVERGVEQGNQQVDKNVDKAEQQHDTLDDRIIAPEDGVDREAPDARDREHRLGDDGATDQQRDADANHGYDGDSGVLEGMNEHDGGLPHTLGARRADV